MTATLAVQCDQLACTNPALILCENCRKPTCAGHTVKRYSEASPVAVTYECAPCWSERAHRKGMRA